MKLVNPKEYIPTGKCYRCKDDDEHQLWTFNPSTRRGGTLLQLCMTCLVFILRKVCDENPTVVDEDTRGEE